MADFDGDGIDIPLVGCRGFFIQGDALNHFSLKTDDEVRGGAGIGIVEIVAVLLCGCARICDIMNDDIANGGQFFSPPGGAIYIDQLLVHPVGRGNLPWYGARNAGSRNDPKTEYGGEQQDKAGADKDEPRGNMAFCGPVVRHGRSLHKSWIV